MTDDSPPKYEDVVQNDNVTLNIDSTSTDLSPSAPLLDEEVEDESDFAALIRRLDCAVQLSEILKFSLGSKSSEDHHRNRYEFFMRDPMEFLVAKGTVSANTGDTTIIAYNATDKTFLELITEEDLSRIYNVNTVFKVNHCDVRLGSVSIDKNSLDSLEVKNNFEKSIYTITTHEFQKTADIKITKEAITVPVCRIHINPPKYTLDLSFNASISLSNCNTIEKYLFISIAIAYMVSRNMMLLNKEVQKISNEADNFSASEECECESRYVIRFLILIFCCTVIYIVYLFRVEIANNFRHIVMVGVIIVFIIMSLLSLVNCINQVRRAGF